MRDGLWLRVDRIKELQSSPNLSREEDQSCRLIALPNCITLQSSISRIFAPILFSTDCDSFRVW